MGVMTDNWRAELRAAAEKATTRGAWYADGTSQQGQRHLRYDVLERGKPLAAAEWWPDAVFIAAASPDVVLALLDAAEDAEQAQDRLREKVAGLRAELEAAREERDAALEMHGVQFERANRLDQMLAEAQSQSL